MLLFNYLNSLILIFNNLSNLIFYSLVIVTVGLIGFSVCYSLNNVNNNVTDINVDPFSNNVNSDGDTQTEDPSLNPGNLYLYPIHEEKYQELLEILGPSMQEKFIDELCLQYMVYSYSVEDLTLRSDIDIIIIARFCLTFLS